MRTTTRASALQDLSPRHRTRGDAVRNVHERTIRGDLDEAGAMLDRVGGPDDVWWPSEHWVPMVLDRPLGVGARGGHGAVRYHVIEHVPGRRVVLRFHPKVGLLGTHTFDVVAAGPGSVTLRHVIEARPVGSMHVLWPLVVRWLHDAVLEDLLDNAERALTGAVAEPARHSIAVRVLGRLTAPLDRGPNARSPLQALLPDPDAVAHHSLVVSAPPERVSAALRGMTLADMPIARALFAARGLTRNGVRSSQPLLSSMEEQGFRVLADEPPCTLAMGAIGQPWRFRGDLVEFVGAEGFVACAEPRLAKMAMAFTLTSVPGGTRVDEETRVECTDAAARRRFRLYWLPVRFGSGIVRRQMLSAVARAVREDVQPLSITRG